MSIFQYITYYCTKFLLLIDYKSAFHAIRDQMKLFKIHFDYKKSFISN